MSIFLNVTELNYSLQVNNTPLSTNNTFSFIHYLVVCIIADSTV
jgi:hypothetical protein